MTGQHIHNLEFTITFYNGPLVKHGRSLRGFLKCLHSVVHNRVARETFVETQEVTLFYTNDAYYAASND